MTGKLANICRVCASRVTVVYRIEMMVFWILAWPNRSCTKNAALLLVDIGVLQQRHFGSPQPVMIGQMKEGTVALARDDGKETADLRLGEEGERRRGRGVLLGFHGPTV